MIRGYRALREDERWLPHLSRICRVPSRSAYCKRRKISRRGAPSSPKPNLAGTAPQGMTFRPCCLDSSRAVFPTFWWGGIWLWASANAILFRFPYHIRILSRPPSFFVPFSLRRVASATLPEHILVLRFPLIAIPQFVWIRKVQYGIMRNIIEMDDNEKWKYVWLLFEWNRMMYVEIEYICI